MLKGNGGRSVRRNLEERLNSYGAHPDIEIEMGGRIRFTQPQFTENRAAGEKAHPAEPIVHETDSPTEYITVHYQNGNYEWFELNFRVRDGTAYLSSKMRVDRPRNGSGWVPGEVKEVIREHHPELKVSSCPPPWWE